MQRANEILAAAREVFLEKGFARSSVSEVAARVGIVESLVYSYYPSKRDLLNAVLRGMYEPLLVDISDKFERLHGVRSRMRFLIWRHLRVYVEEPNLSRLVLHEVRTGPEYFQSVLHDLHVRYTDFLMRTVQDGMADGELHPDTDAELVRSMVYGGIEHRMWGTLFGQDRIDVEAMADRLTEMVLGPVLPAGRAYSAIVAAGDRPLVAQAIDEARRCLAQIEKSLLNTSSTNTSSTASSTVAPTSSPKPHAATRGSGAGDRKKTKAK
jgi:AcrR family transcriptional regulator